MSRPKSTKQAMVWAMHLEGHSNVEIAKYFGMDEKAVSSKIAKMRHPKEKTYAGFNPWPRIISLEERVKELESVVEKYFKEKAKALERINHESRG